MTNGFYPGYAMHAGVEVIGMTNINQILCKHEWTKVGGPQRAGPGQFSQHFRCIKCNKMKQLID